jgi:uncharacterized membrane protein YccC
MLGTLAGRHIALAIVLTFLVALVGSLARVWGAAGASVGGAFLSTFVIALAFPPQSEMEALTRPAFAILGGLWAMMIALVVWPLQPYRPARLAVATSYRALADYTDSVVRHLEAAAAGETSEPPVGSATVRGALEDARAALTQGRRGRPGTSGREERLVVLGEVVDQLFGHIVAVVDTVDTIRPADRLPAAEAALSEALRALIASARTLAIAVEAERDPPSVSITWSGARLHGILASSPETDDDVTLLHYRQAAAILDRAAQYAAVAAETVAGLNEGHAPAVPARELIAEEPDDAPSPFATLRAVLAPDSIILRYALRVAVVTTVAVALAQLLHVKRGYWMTITAIVILQPYTGITTTRALQRVIGTVLGAIITAALGALFHDPRAILVLSFLFAAACIAFLPVNYAAFSVFLTPTFVLVAEASAGDWHLAATRVLNTLLGGALALAGSRLLWPSPEWSRLPGYLAASLRANREYLRSVVELYDDRSEQASARIREARRRTGLASVNAEESFQRLLGEYHGAPGELSPLLTFLTYSRRLTASIAALALTRHTSPGASSTTLASLLSTATTVIDDLESSVADGRAPAPLPRIVATRSSGAGGAPPIVRARVDRLARQLRLLHDAVGRWKAEGDSPRSPSDYRAGGPN